jgi:signal transduction histidine kinase
MNSSKPILKQNSTGAERSTEERSTDLRRRLAEQDATIAALTAELAETNQGVVALYAELDDRAEQLRQATELKSRFLSYMSHEFRTPLSSIVSIARILTNRLDGELNAEQEKQIEFIRGAANELTDMVDDLLDLAKIEAGRIVVSPEWFDMVDLFAALRGMFKPVLDTHTLSLIFEEPVDVGRVYTDHAKLAQILRNFISNALKFTQKGEVRVSAVGEDAMVTFSVTDTGIGIAPEHLGALFQDFVQIDSPIQKRWRGTGLGLSLSKRLATLLGGSVGVRSLLGAGSTFYVTIPDRFPETVNP